VCTFNRGELLTDALISVLSQSPSPQIELIVVDNNSTDSTREIVECLAESDGRVRYVFEPRQGLSYARNTGIAAARAPLIAFTDDDVRVRSDWTMQIVRAFREHRGVGMVGGRVLPVWPASPPAWLTRDHWAPLALADHGDEPIGVTPARPICLVGANMAYQRDVFDAIGGFATNLQRVGDGIGSLEDHEFLLRALAAGRTGMYDPRIVVHAEIQSNRLDRRYHRRWHFGHGHFHALLQSPEVERSARGTVFGVPAHLYRQAAADVAGWLRGVASRDPARTFHHELRLRFFAGFFLTRQRQPSASSAPETHSPPHLQAPIDAHAGREHR
jgi:GT2 family glycosyltransferase